MARKHEIDVAVVGAGPVGLLAALALRQAGVNAAVFDTNRRTGQHSYATILHPASVALLDRFGLRRACAEHGRAVETVQLFEGTERRGELGLARLGGPHPYLLVLPQSRLESILEDALAEGGAAVQWEHRVQALEPAAHGVEIVVAKLDTVSTGYPIARSERVVERTFELGAKFVVGADGYDSFVRRRLGIDNPAAGEAETVSVYQCEATDEIPAEGRLAFAENGVAAYWPLPHGRCRFSFPIASAAEHRPDEAGLAGHLAAWAPWFRAQVRGIEWTAHARFERKLASSYGADRVWLAGDAAHLASPAGAQSMNVGLREALDLAERLAAVLKGKAGSESLVAYGERQQVEWRRLLGLDGGLRGDPGTFAGARAARILPCIPASGADLEALAGQLGLAFGPA